MSASVWYNRDEGSQTDSPPLNPVQLKLAPTIEPECFPLNQAHPREAEAFLVDTLGEKRNVDIPSQIIEQDDLPDYDPQSDSRALGRGA
ncbi:unnamed protein product [Parascedosporium putredinis]|uniref:Uncharacterized protein n=1 Tax=Parascedosporium putredinis TaxID=1442378 RepID=A0A9P1MDI4_9PEZI|nr:unnamed protein product [Parascedosporium putredinis]CAI8003763.1 unnamed protein product [Parascedosporium putredinis]